MFLPVENQSTYTPIEAGTYPARCYRFIDLGTQKIDYQGDEKFQHKVLISWELPTELRDDGQPQTISKRYTWSMSDKASLRKHLEAWRGKPFVPADFGEGGFNVRKILGTACILSITQDTRDSKTYSGVSSVSSPMKGLEVAPLVNDMVFFALTEDGYSKQVFESLSEKVREAISGSPEYQELMINFSQQKSAQQYAEASGG